jgi:predicted signal transduction protein with EAL and GGDEF domain
VIAEGVTTPAQVELLREMGCGFAQGYLYSPPVGLEEAVALLQRRNAERDRRGQVLEARGRNDLPHGGLPSGLA